MDFELEGDYVFMSITSFYFFLFIMCAILFYYIVPRKMQWFLLVVYSVVFFVLSSTPYTGIYLVIAIISTHICANGIYKNIQNRKVAKRFLLLGIIINAGMLVILKYSNFGINNANFILSKFGLDEPIETVSWLAPLGISFYTMQIIAYLVDVYGGITEADTNILKTTLFIGYFPQLTSGPIAKHEEMKNQLFDGHKFEVDNFIHGWQRILWGVFKKIVVSARLGIIVDTIYANPTVYDGLYIWIAAMLFLIQLYTDFSGCMDIVLGASECFGIILPENFEVPFFARSVQEFWQKWHITLGGWLRDYIMYPVMRSNLWRKITSKLKKKCGRKASKEIPTYLAMFIVWIMFGLWHGGQWKFIIGEGLFCYICILTGKLTEPFMKKIISYLKINVETVGWHIFQSLRVFVLMSVANMFFRIDSFKGTLDMMKYGISHWNPWILLDNSIYQLGLSEKNVRLMFVGVIIVFIVDFLGTKIKIRVAIDRQNLLFRWIIWAMLIFSIIIFGYYGSGYDAASFIYGHF